MVVVIQILLRLDVEGLPDAAENTRRLLELGGRDGILVHRGEQKLAELERRTEDLVTHPDLAERGVERSVHDVGDHRIDPL